MVMPCTEMGNTSGEADLVKFGLERASGACQTLVGVLSGQMDTPAWIQAAAVNSETTVVLVLVFEMEKRRKIQQRRLGRSGC